MARDVFFYAGEGKWAFLNQCISMAVPTWYQHQNRGRILIFHFKIFSGSRRCPPGTFWARFWYFLGTFLVHTSPCCPNKILSHIWRPSKSVGSDVLFVLFPIWDFLRLSWTTIDFFLQTSQNKEKHMLFMVLTPLPPKRDFHHFCPCFLSKCIQDKDKQKISMCKCSRRGHSRKQNVLI